MERDEGKKVLEKAVCKNCKKTFWRKVNREVVFCTRMGCRESRLITLGRERNSNNNNNNIL